MLVIRHSPMGGRDFSRFAICGKRGILMPPLNDVGKRYKAHEFSTHFSTHGSRFHIDPQGPLPISARTPSTVWRNSASTLIASSTLRMEWITVE